MASALGAAGLLSDGAAIAAVARDALSSSKRTPETMPPIRGMKLARPS